MSYQPPQHLLEVLQKIQYEEALPAGDPRYVETQTARGSERTFSRLAKKIGWDPASNQFFPPGQSHVLFFGHVGSGKTTELRQYAQRLNDSKRFCVIEVDAVDKLDVNNLQYTDALMAMAETLVKYLDQRGYRIWRRCIGRWRRW
jgi:Cdc6-like AAA superfamily ATPase